jgi:RNA polymerase sigma-70 factor (ECF subfamily)
VSTTELVRRVEAGDRKAEEELIQRYSRGVTYLLRHLTRDPVLSDDLHQDTFRTVLERVRRGELEDPEKLAGFVHGTARNMARAERRKRLRRGLTVSEENHQEQAPWEPADPSPNQETELQWRQEAELARQLLAELRSQRDREVLFRYCVAEQDKELICSTLGLSSLQFNVVLCRARKRFRKLYESRIGALGFAIGALLVTLCL